MFHLCQHLPGDITHHLNVKLMLSNVTVLFSFLMILRFLYLTVNTMDELQLLIFIYVALLPNLCDLSLCNSRRYTSGCRFSRLRLSAI